MWSSTSMSFLSSRVSKKKRRMSLWPRAVNVEVGFNYAAITYINFIICKITNVYRLPCAMELLHQ